MEQRKSSRKTFLKGLAAACAGGMLWLTPGRAAPRNADADGDVSARAVWPQVRKSPRAVVRDSINPVRRPH